MSSFHESSRRSTAGTSAPASPQQRFGLFHDAAVDALLRDHRDRLLLEPAVTDEGCDVVEVLLQLLVLLRQRLVRGFNLAVLLLARG